MHPVTGVVVVGSGREQVEPLVAEHGGVVVVQEPQLGTAHAVLQARDSLGGFDGDVLILYGDTPLVGRETMQRVERQVREPRVDSARHRSTLLVEA